MAEKIIKEVSFDQLPESFKRFFEPHISSQEKTLFCVYGTSSSQRATVVLLTDFKLLFIAGDGMDIVFPDNFSRTWEYRLWTINLEEITQSFAKNIRYLGSLGFLSPYFYWASIVVSSSMKVNFPEADGLRFYFMDQALAEKFSLTLTKAVTEAKVRLRNPVQGSAASKVPDVADQLIKLKNLRDDGTLTEAEFEAAKRKMLGT